MYFFHEYVARAIGRTPTTLVADFVFGSRGCHPPHKQSTRIKEKLDLPRSSSHVPTLPPLARVGRVGRFSNPPAFRR